MATFSPEVFSATAVESLGLFSIVTFLQFEDLEVVDVGGGSAGAFLGLACLTFLLNDDEGLEEGLEVDVWAVVDCFLGDFVTLEEEFSPG